MICYHVPPINKASSDFWCNIQPTEDNSPSADIPGLEMSFDSFL